MPRNPILPYLPRNPLSTTYPSLGGLASSNSFSGPNPSIASNIASASNPSENTGGAIKAVDRMSDIVEAKYGIGQPPANDPTITPMQRAQHLKIYLSYV